METKFRSDPSFRSNRSLDSNEISISNVRAGYRSNEIFSPIPIQHSEELRGSLHPSIHFPRTPLFFSNIAATFVIQRLSIFRFSALFLFLLLNPYFIDAARISRYQPNRFPSRLQRHPVSPISAMNFQTPRILLLLRCSSTF